MIIDTNVFLSYMLAPERPNTVTAVVTACLSLDEIDLLVPPEQITEFKGKAATKRYFRRRIPHQAIEEFVAHLRVLRDCLKSNGCQPRRGVSCSCEQTTIPERFD